MAALLFLAAILCFCNLFGLSLQTSMQNLELVAKKWTSYAQFSILSHAVPYRAVPMTNLRIQLRASRQLKINFVFSQNLIEHFNRNGGAAFASPTGLLHSRNYWFIPVAQNEKLPEPNNNNCIGDIGGTQKSENTKNTKSTNSWIDILCTL